MRYELVKSTTESTWLHARAVFRVRQWMLRLPMARLGAVGFFSLACLVLFQRGLCAQINLAPPNQPHSAPSNRYPTGPQDGNQQSQQPPASPQFRTASQPNFRTQQLPVAQPQGGQLPAAQPPGVQNLGVQGLAGQPGLQVLAPTFVQVLLRSPFPQHPKRPRRLAMRSRSLPKRSAIEFSNCRRRRTWNPLLNRR